MNREFNSEQEEMYGAFSQHIVALRFTFGGPQGEVPFIVSGFVVELRGDWLFVTAGHIEDAIREHARRRFDYQYCDILDGFHPQRVFPLLPIRFAYDPGRTLYCDDDVTGIDVAIIGLGPNVPRLLEANNVVPLRDDQWKLEIRTRGPRPTEAYLVGFPAKHVAQLGSTAMRMELNVVPVVLQPVEMPTEQKILRFRAKLNPGEPNIAESIPGMSGCPWFVWEKQSGETDYWVMAVQSSMLRDGGIVIGCPLWVFMDTLERQLDAQASS